MKPDPDYVKKILTAFEESPEPTTNIRELDSYGLSCDSNEFYFHLRLLNDGGFVVREDDRPGIGCTSSADGLYQWSVLPLRLTASGHEFAGALKNNKAMEAVKKYFAGSGLSIMRDIGVAVLKSELSKHGFGMT